MLLLTRGGTSLILDGKVESTWADISTFLFSPDSQRYAYVGLAPYAGAQLVIDGRPGQKYPSLELFGFTPDSSHTVAKVFGGRLSDPGLEGGFLLIDDDYESNAWVSAHPPSQWNQKLFEVVRLGFSGPRSVYAVSMFISPNQVYFDRIDIDCP